MALQLYDTMTRKKRAFVPINPERVTMYVCGPTVYNYAHIGNARPVVVFDVLFRLLRSIFGERHVLYAANVTDVDDKINQKAIAEGVPIETITQRYLDAYHADMSALGALKPTFEPRATGTMDAIIAMIERLVRNNAAYEDRGPRALQHRGLFRLRQALRPLAGRHDRRRPRRRRALQAEPGRLRALEAVEEGEPVWESPFGPGRPGWHIECSAMIDKSLGLPIDIHGGGNDLIFPHHENEMAQGLCADHADAYANYWLHNGFLNFGAEKMSKSLGNVVLAHDLVTQVPPARRSAGRCWPRTTASRLHWSDEVLEQATRSLDTALRGAAARRGRAGAGDRPERRPSWPRWRTTSTRPRRSPSCTRWPGGWRPRTGVDRAAAKGELLASGHLSASSAPTPRPGSRAAPTRR